MDTKILTLTKEFFFFNLGWTSKAKIVLCKFEWKGIKAKTNWKIKTVEIKCTFFKKYFLAQCVQYFANQYVRTTMTIHIDVHMRNILFTSIRQTYHVIVFLLCYDICFSYIDGDSNSIQFKLKKMRRKKNGAKLLQFFF